MITKTGRQLPKYAIRRSTSAGATAAPTEDPLSKSATAQPRSRRGNHSETAFVAPGQLAASPAPSRKRKPQKLRSPVARDVRTATVEYHRTETVRPRRVPMRSSTRPETVCITAYAMRNAMMIRAKSWFDQLNSVLRVGPRTLSVCRSR